MRNWKNRLGMTGIILLCLLTCLVPSFFARVEDEHLQTKTKKYQIEEISLSSTQIKTEIVLRDFAEVLKGNVMVKDYVMVEKLEESQEISGESREYGIIREEIQEFLNIFGEEITADFQKMTISSIVMSDVNLENIYPLWKCLAADENEKEYVFWLDAVNEKVVSFEIPVTFSAFDEKIFVANARELAGYYGLAYGGFVSSEKLFVSEDDWEDDLWFVTEEEELLLPIYKQKGRIGFNQVQWKVAIYDSNTQVSSG